MPTRNLKVVLGAVDKASPILKKFGGVLTGVGTIAATVGVVQIGRKLVDGMQAAVASAGEYEGAATRLAVALANQGQNTAANRNEFLQFADSLSLASQATETQILSAIGQAKALGASNDAAKSLIAAATDLAVAIGVDNDTAFRQVTRTLGGYAGELGELVPELKNLSSEQLKAGGAAEILQKKFGGAGAAGANTLIGSINNTASEFDKLKRNIGQSFAPVITQVINQALIPFIQKLKELSETKSFQNAMLGFADVLITAGEGAVKLTKALLALITLTAGPIISAESYGTLLEMIGSLEDLDNSLDEVQKTIAKWKKDGIPALAADVPETFGNAKTAVDLLRESLSALGLKTFQQLSAEAEQVNAAMLKLNEAFFAGDISAAEYRVASDQLAELAQKLREAGIEMTLFADLTEEKLVTVSDQVQALVSGGIEELNKLINQNAAALETLGESITGTLKGAGVSAATDIGDALVSAAEQGSFAWGKFFKQLLKDFIKAIVRALILKAIVAAITGGGGGGAASYGVGVGTAYRKGGIVGARNGYLVGGFDRGRDSVPIIARPGEAVLPKELTDFLMRAAAARSGSMPTEIIVRTDVPSFVEIVSDNVNRGTARLVATETRTGRGVR